MVYPGGRLGLGCRLKSLLLSPRWVPESARWLLTQGQVEEARRYLLRCARINGKPVGEDSLSLEVRMNMRVSICKYVYMCGPSQALPSWGPLCVQENFPAQVESSLRMSYLVLGGYTLDSAFPTQLPCASSSPPYCRREEQRDPERAMCLAKATQSTLCCKLSFSPTRP